jgi:SAM-dependent methyltransferase
MNVVSEHAVKLDRLKDYRPNLDDPSYLVYRRLFADLEKAAVNAHGALLDIGCGNKPYEKMFVDKITSYTGCDVAQSSEERVDIICPATAIPLPSDHFQTVLCTQVIEHVADHKALLSEAYRLLSAGGVLILSGPLYWPLHEEPHDYFRFTEHGFRYLLNESGFSGVEIMPNGGKWALCGQALIHSIENTWLYRRSALRFVNYVFGYLDNRYLDTKNPLNYVVIAKKPQANHV